MKSAVFFTSLVFATATSVLAHDNSSSTNTTTAVPSLSPNNTTSLNNTSTTIGSGNSTNTTSTMNNATITYAPLFDPSLNSTCIDAAQKAFSTLATSCVNNMDVVKESGTSSRPEEVSSALLQSLGIHYAEKMMEKICDKKCLDAGDAFQKEIEASSCGTKVLVSPALIKPNTTAPLNAANLNNYLKFLQPLICTKVPKDDKKFCYVEMGLEMNAKNVSVSQKFDETFQPIINYYKNGTNVTTGACVKKMMETAEKSTSWVDYERFKPTLETLKKDLSKVLANGGSHDRTVSISMLITATSVSVLVSAFML